MTKIKTSPVNLIIPFIFFIYRKQRFLRFPYLLWVLTLRYLNDICTIMILKIVCGYDIKSEKLKFVKYCLAVRYMTDFVLSACWELQSTVNCEESWGKHGAWFQRLGQWQFPNKKETFGKVLFRGTFFTSCFAVFMYWKEFTINNNKYYL